MTQAPSGSPCVDKVSGPTTFLNCRPMPQTEIGNGPDFLLSTHIAHGGREPRSSAHYLWSAMWRSTIPIKAFSRLFVSRTDVFVASLVSRMLLLN